MYTNSILRKHIRYDLLIRVRSLIAITVCTEQIV